MLADRAPKLWKAGRDAKSAGYPHVVIDGTLIEIDRVAADRPFYSGKHKEHGMTLQVIASPCGEILWVSGALPGHVHDKKFAGGILSALGTSSVIGAPSALRGVSVVCPAVRWPGPPAHGASPLAVVLSAGTLGGTSGEAAFGSAGTGRRSLPWSLGSVGLP